MPRDGRARKTEHVPGHIVRRRRDVGAKHVPTDEEQVFAQNLKILMILSRQSNARLAQVLMRTQEPKEVSTRRWLQRLQRTGRKKPRTVDEKTSLWHLLAEIGVPFDQMERLWDKNLFVHPWHNSGTPKTK